MAKELEYLDPNKVVIVGLDTSDDESHPLYDERVNLELDESLVRSILLYGVLDPIIVRYENGTCFVVDGRQRVRAAREAKARQSEEGAPELKVPTKAIVDEDRRMRGIIVTVNELRRADDVLTKARKVMRLMRYYDDIDEVAVTCGKSVTTVRNYIALMEADPVLHAAIEGNKISASAAIEIAAYPREEQAKTLEAVLRSGEREAARKAAPAAGPVSVADVRETASKDRKEQRGIKRSWIRKALRSAAAEDLDDINRQTLEWFAEGKEVDGTWFTEFVLAVEKEQ